MIPPQLLQVFGDTAKGIVQGVFGGKGLDGLFTSKEEKMNAQAKLNEISAELELAVKGHLLKMSELQYQETKAYLEDRANARSMQIAALAQGDNFSKRYVYYLATGLIVITFIFDLMFFFVSYPERNHDIINMIAGVINTVGFASVVSFFFGSSKGSEDKSKQLNAMIDGKAKP